MSRGDYEEKRDHRRMCIDCPMTFTVVDSGEVHRGVARDLSATGMRIECERPLSEGTLLEVKVAPDRPIVPPLEALVEVVRVEVSAGGACLLGVVIREFRSGS